MENGCSHSSFFGCDVIGREYAVDMFECNKWDLSDDVSKKWVDDTSVTSNETRYSDHVYPIMMIVILNSPRESGST